jgi:sec-independent protein translocase protein TatA
MPFGIGPWEIAVVVIIALVIFGPKRLPELGSSLGKAITGFKSGIKSSEEEIRAALKDDASAVPADQPTIAATQAVVAEPVVQPVAAPVAAPVAQPLVASAPVAAAPVVAAETVTEVVTAPTAPTPPLSS